MSGDELALWVDRSTWIPIFGFIVGIAIVVYSVVT